MATTFPRLAVCVEVYLDTVFHAIVEDLAPRMTCSEADATAALYREVGRDQEADAILDAHSYGDNETDDLHYRAELWPEYKEAI